MVAALLSRLFRIRLPVTFAVLVIGVATAVAALGPQVLDPAIRAVGTHLDDLRHGDSGAFPSGVFGVGGSSICLGLGALARAVPRRWRLPALVLGFVVLTHTGLSVWAGVGLSLAGAVAADRLARHRMVRRSAAAAVLVAGGPALSG